MQTKLDTLFYVLLIATRLLGIYALWLGVLGISKALHVFNGLSDTAPLTVGMLRPFAQPLLLFILGVWAIYGVDTPKKRH